MKKKIRTASLKQNLLVLIKKECISGKRLLMAASDIFLLKFLKQKYSYYDYIR